MLNVQQILMYQLSERKNNKFVDPLLAKDLDVVVQNQQRSCTDIICLILFLIGVGVFIGLLVYGIISGDPQRVISVYNSDQVKCMGTPNTQYGFFPTLGKISNAVCVSQCPSNSQMTVTCLTDTSKCTSGTITATYQTTAFYYYCMPVASVGNQDLTQIFNGDAYRAWAYELRQGWMVLVGAGVAAMISSLLFLVFIRCCAGIVIWFFIFVAVAGLETVGILFILEAKGVKISSFISDNLSTLSYNSLIIIGSGMIAAGVLIAILTICLRSKIALGSKSVELGAIFLFENCCFILLPISQAIFIVSGLAAIIVGGIYLYSIGNLSFPDNIAFPVITLSTLNIVAVAGYLFGGFWLIFFFHGCEYFILCSAVSIWYFNHESPNNAGAPFGDSIHRLIRYHPGSVAITALINGLLSVLAMIANLLSFEAGPDDSGLKLCCLKFLSFIFCIFKCFLRFLNDGTYVQIAVNAQGYCSSTYKAFNIIADHITKFSITDGISIFFKILGMLGISVGVAVSAYFCLIKIQALAILATNPIVITIVSGLIAFAISAIYLSLIDLSAQSIMQCYCIDLEFHGGYPKHAREQFKDIMLVDK